MAQPITPTTQIAKQLGLTPSGLRTLARAAADLEGWATGAGKGFGAMGSCPRLARDGLVELVDYCVEVPSNYGFMTPGRQRYRITENGIQKLREARALCW
jgi:hypothetical protein